METPTPQRASEITRWYFDEAGKIPIAYVQDGRVMTMRPSFFDTEASIVTVGSGIRAGKTAFMDQYYKNFVASASHPCIRELKVEQQPIFSLIGNFRWHDLVVPAGFGSRTWILVSQEHWGSVRELLPSYHQTLTGRISTRHPTSLLVSALHPITVATLVARGWVATTSWFMNQRLCNFKARDLTLKTSRSIFGCYPSSGFHPRFTP